MKHKYLAVLFLLGAGIGLGGFARGQSAKPEDLKKELHIIKLVGLGATSCGRFIELVRQKPQLERDYFAWAQGYMSGLLRRAPDGSDVDLDLLPPTFPLTSQISFIQKFCENNMNEAYIDAVETLYRTLRAPKS